MFINICGSDAVPAPGGWANGAMPAEVEAALEKESLTKEESDMLRFPLSLGPPQRELDKKGEPCLALDMIFNAGVLRQAQALRKLKYFIIDLALNWVDHRHGMQLDRKFKLPKMRYKGDRVLSQRIRIDSKRKALVTELRDSPDDVAFPLVTKKLPLPPPPQQQQQKPATAAATTGAPPLAAAAAALRAPTAAAARTPAGGASSADLGSAAAAAEAPEAPSVGQPLQYSVSYEGRPVQLVRLQVDLPAASVAAASADNVSAEVCGTDVYISVPQCPRLHVKLPLAVSAGPGASAALGPDAKLLLQLPYLPLEEQLARMRAEAPLAFGQLQFANQSFLELE